MDVARGIRFSGVALALVGLALLVIDARWTPIPWWLSYGVVGCAFVLMGFGIAARTRYHRRRMRGEG